MYEVSYTGRVRQHLREVANRNRARLTEIDRALKLIERLLHVYPQYGQPLCDMTTPGTQLWVLTVPPFVVHYLLVEADDRGRRRQVSILRPLTPLPNSGLV